MKKALIALFALFYLAVSSGFTLHMHYCMNKLADWSFGPNNSKTCSMCGMEKSDEKDNGCCKDEHKFLKNNSDQKTAETEFSLIQLVAVALPVSFVEISPVYSSSVAEENPRSHAPPRSYGVAVYIRNCVFLI